MILKNKQMQAMEAETGLDVRESILRAVEETGHLVHAADKLGYAPSTLHRWISELNGTGRYRGGRYAVEFAGFERPRRKRQTVGAA